VRAALEFAREDMGRRPKRLSPRSSPTESRLSSRSPKPQFYSG
jgi:hypothetical protein